MSDLATRDAFVQYLTAHPSLAPLIQFPARAQEANKPPFPIYSSPLGHVLLYPAFLAFLSVSREKPGGGLLAKEMGKLALEQIPFVPIGEAIAERIVGHKESLQELVENPNSFFLPFDRITGAEGRRQWNLTHYIQVMAGGRSYIFQEDSQAEGAIAGMRYLFSGEWHADAVALLLRAAKTNASQRAPHGAIRRWSPS